MDDVVPNHADDVEDSLRFGLLGIEGKRDKTSLRLLADGVAPKIVERRLKLLVLDGS